MDTSAELAAGEHKQRWVNYARRKYSEWKRKRNEFIVKSFLLEILPCWFKHDEAFKLKKKKYVISIIFKYVQLFYLSFGLREFFLPIVQKGQKTVNERSAP